MILIPLRQSLKSLYGSDLICGPVPRLDMESAFVWQPSFRHEPLGSFTNL